MPTMTGLHLLVADLRCAELCVLGWKSVVRHSIFVLYPNDRGRLFSSSDYGCEHESFSTIIAAHNPLIQSP
jgi:hypothetical protein